MTELGICNPPFEDFCIQVKSSLIKKINDLSFGINYHKSFSDKSELIFIYKHNSLEETVRFFLSTNGIDFKEFTQAVQADYKEAGKYFTWLAVLLRELLIVLLATKNIQKDVETCNKPNSRNRREQTLSKYSSTTTISIGKISKTMRSADGTGGPVRPHLRRGHIRNQPYGTGNSEVKRIFIQPMFINADQGWIDTKKEYRVTA